MCLVAQVVGAPVQCSEGCEQHNLAISLSVHFRCLSRFFCLFRSLLFWLFCMPVLLDYLVSQVVSVPDHILDTFKFSKCLGLALDPASPLYPQNIRNIWPPSRQIGDQWFRAVRSKISCLSACFLSQSINQSVNQPAQSTASISKCRQSLFVKVYSCHRRVFACPRGLGRGW